MQIQIFVEILLLFIKLNGNGSCNIQAMMNLSLTLFLTNFINVIEVMVHVRIPYQSKFYRVQIYLQKKMLNGSIIIRKKIRTRLGNIRE